MISGKDIIHFSLDDYWKSDPHSRHHLTNQFWKNNNRVFWVNSFGMRIPNITKKGNARRYIIKIKSYLKYIRKVKERFWVISPIALPLLGSGYLAKINEIFLLKQIEVVIKILRIRNPILFVTSPMFPSVIKKIAKEITIYYYSDKYAAYREIKNRDLIAKLDNITIDLADFIFCASKEIFNEVARKSSNVFYLPHGVDFEHFNGVLYGETEIPRDMKDIRKPIVGYFGSLSDSNDIELIKYLAMKRPEYSIIIIGNPSVEFMALGSIPNIHILGRKNYQEIPLYGKYFDVCFMAWKMTEWIKKCSPLKTKEYLALGKPVVSIPIDEIINEYKDVIDIAYDQEDFVEKIDYSLNNDSTQKQQERIEFVRNDTWEDRFAQMVNIIERKYGLQRISI